MFIFNTQFNQYNYTMLYTVLLDVHNIGIEFKHIEFTIVCIHVVKLCILIDHLHIRWA